MQQQPSLPNWLNQDFLEKAIRSYRKDSIIKLESFEFSYGFSEHFASQMCSCKMKFNSFKYPKVTSEKLNVVIKIEPPKDDIKASIVENKSIFEAEIRMYAETLPLMQNLLERSGFDNELAPE